MEANVKNIAVLGSTGSIGTQTLDVVRRSDGAFKANILAAHRNVDLLIEQAREFKPALAIIVDETLHDRLREALRPMGIATACGSRAVEDAMGRDDFSTVVTATVGYSGLRPTLAAIANDKTIALANKETMVVAGELINAALARSKSRIIPVDSEHSAIYQCLAGEKKSEVDRLIITASGGPFRNSTQEELSQVTLEDALKHPRWVMGAKITIDSATMMNKAFEIVEARWLFDIAPERIEAVIHPQSIVHSMVQFSDGAVKAQLGLPDMRLPIAYALDDCGRRDFGFGKLTIADYSTLTFEKPDYNRFPALSLAHEMLERRGTVACTVNAANEVAVSAFLNGKIRFLDIYNVIRETMAVVASIENPTLDDYEMVNRYSRLVAGEMVLDHLIK